MSKLHIIDIRDTLEIFYNLMECPKINIIVTIKKNKIKRILGLWILAQKENKSKQQKQQKACSSGKEPACQCRRHKRCGSDYRVGKIPWRRSRKPTPVFLPGESHGHRRLVGYNIRGHRKSDMTEMT